MEPGERVGAFEVLGRLGAGGMGVVYRARDTRLGREVALKTLPAALAENPDRLARLRREARFLASLNHPHIATLFDVEEAHGATVLVMELVEGPTLAERIQRGPLRLQKALDLARQMAGALEAAHGRGVLHRDLKPSNVAVDDQGQVKLLDFGLAKMVESDGPMDSQVSTGTSPPSEPGTVVGTGPYMSPEQARGEAVDERSDIWAFGCVLYEMITGRKAFGGGSRAETMAAVLEREPNWDVLPGATPPSVRSLLRRCLRKDSAERLRDAADARLELQEAIGELDARAASTTPPAAPHRWGPGRRTAAVAGLVGAIALAFVLPRYLSTGPTPVASKPAIQSLAVLPLHNLMNDSAQQYFVDGMTEALIANLAKIHALKVISETSSLRYKGTTKRLPEITRELGVDAVVEGSVLRSGDEVRITVQLVDGRTDANLWGNSYDRRVENVLAVHGEVARAVAHAVRLTLTRSEEERLASSATVDRGAYEAYLKGNDSLNRLAMDEALRYFEQAIEADPRFARPRAARALTLVGAAIAGAMPPRPLYQEAEAAAREALDLDDSLAEAHQALGWVRLLSDWDWPAAARRFERAIELSPSSPAAHFGYSNYLLVVRRPEEAMAQARLARRLDPLSAITQQGVIWNLYLARRYGAVLEEGETVLEMFPHHPLVHSLMTSACLREGRVREALAHAKQQGGAFDEPEVREALDRGQAASGVRGAWRAAAEVLVARSKRHYVYPTQIALLYAASEDREPLLHWLERMVAEHVAEAPCLALEPAWDGVRSDPRFERLVRRMRLPR